MQLIVQYHDPDPCNRTLSLRRSHSIQNTFYKENTFYMHMQLVVQMHMYSYHGILMYSGHRNCACMCIIADVYACASPQMAHRPRWAGRCATPAPRPAKCCWPGDGGLRLGRSPSTSAPSLVAGRCSDCSASISRPAANSSKKSDGNGLLFTWTSRSVVSSSSRTITCMRHMRVSVLRTDSAPTSVA